MNVEVDSRDNVNVMYVCLNEHSDLIFNEEMVGERERMTTDEDCDGVERRSDY